MKALSLWQPWASFIAIGVKPFETRSWAPPAALIGQRIAIHAAKKSVPADDQEWGRRCGVPELPRGAVVCTAVLAGAYQCSRTSFPHDLFDLRPARRYVAGSAVLHGGIHQDEFGDYSEGRWAWLLTEIERLEPPFPARGAQGLWDWHG